jgi:thiol-disulfide isomerase/thioredoxin
MDDPLFQAFQEQSEENSFFSHCPPPQNPQTGPKGVLHEYKINALYHKIKKQVENAELMENIKKRAMLLSDCKEEIDEEALSDDEFFIEYTNKRLLELTSERTYFGFRREIQTSLEFLETLENTKVIIVHIYDKNNEFCRIINESLEELAAIYGYASFISIRYEIVELDYFAMPTLQVYENGELVVNKIRINEDSEWKQLMLKNKDVTSLLESLLWKNNILKETLYS